MPSFSSLFTSLTGAGFFYEKSSRHATYNFNQDARSLYRNQPRFPFEYYVNINLNNVGTAQGYISNFFNNPNWAQVQPLIKSVEMPSMKIETTPLNQYNRKRLSQTSLKFEPIKMVFHDVADGKTLKFWEMYYRYYFADGNEPGVNNPKQGSPTPSMTLQEKITQGLNSIIPELNPNITSLFKSTGKPRSPNNTNGNKSGLENIVSDTLDNHNFGFNLSTVQNIRNLIQSIEIFQIHAGRFNSVTLVNPRISAFTHDVLNYAAGDKTLELTFSIEYEYAYYNIQNLKLGGGESNNNSTKNQFEHGEFLELPALAFNAQISDFIESNNPLLNSDNPILQRIGKNVQSSITKTTGAFISSVTRRVSASVLSGMAEISPKPYTGGNGAPAPVARSFTSTAKPTSGKYQDVNRTGGTKNG